MTYVGTIYWFDDLTGYRHRKSIQTNDIADILKPAMMRHLAGELTGYKVVTTEGICEEWWDNKAKAKWANGKDEEV